MLFAVIGGGASGFMAALTAAENHPNDKVIIFEKSREVLSKVRISGGGRCNVTHQPSSPTSFAKNYPRGQSFLKKILTQFDATDTMRWFESRGVRLKTEPDGRVFPQTNSSQTIIQCLLEQADRLGVEIRTGVSVKNFEIIDDQFLLHLHNDAPLKVDRLIVATGGSPKMQGFDWLTQHGHDVAPPVPSLLTFNTPQNSLRTLAGISVNPVEIRIPKLKLLSNGPLLITHWGFSGPAVLKLSAWGARELAELNYRFQLRINWIPGKNFDSLQSWLHDLKVKHPKQQLSAHPQFGIPARLWRWMAENAGIDRNLKLIETPHKKLNKMATQLTDGLFEVEGKTTFKEEFVTCGGIELTNINPLTMESTKIKGLFFTGEVLNVDGITGGFNFQNAWTTGYIAGKNVGQ
ncbi:MAG: NAD(P)/FAD-dependent oxidoreductase [Spirosomataceae bacterium]